MKRILAALLMALFFYCSAYAFNAGDSVTGQKKIGDWKVIEFSGPRQIIYRISTDSINHENTHLVFDFVPSDNCAPRPAIMIMKNETNHEPLPEGMPFPLSYKIPHQDESTEWVRVSEDDNFSFYPFLELTAKKILQTKDKGKFAIWIPGNADGTVKTSDKIYFSLIGFSTSYQTAFTMCTDNK